MSGQAPHIVVVDDEPDARAMVGDYLRMHGFDVALCDGGSALRTHILQRTPDLVVLDLNMPEEDGLSIVRDLKARMALPIIMLTATASAIDRVVGLELGADDYLPKPCELRELVARVRSVLRRAQGVKAVPPASEGQLPVSPSSGPDARQVRFGTKWLDFEALRLRDDEGITRSARSLANACSTSPMPATPTHSTALSTCGSIGFARRSSRTPLIRATSAPCGASATSSVPRATEPPKRSPLEEKTPRPRCPRC
jgi:two-component system OmpR family response regulator